MSSMSSTSSMSSMTSISKYTIDIIFFHYPCQDGLASAFIARDFLHSIGRSDIILVPIQHVQQIDWSIYIKKNILFVDIGPKDEVIELLLSQECQIQILDHHISEKERLEKYPFATFSSTKAGTGMAWEYFCGDEPIPLFLQMMNNQDIWDFSVPGTKAFCASLVFSCESVTSIEDRFNLLDDIQNGITSVESYISMGQILLAHKIKKIETYIEKYKNSPSSFRELTVIKVNMTDYSYVSDLGSELAKFCDFVILWHYDGILKKYCCSLRSSKEKPICSNIAKEMMNGGGHPCAAGGSTEIHPDILFS